MEPDFDADRLLLSSTDVLKLPDLDADWLSLIELLSETNGVIESLSDALFERLSLTLADLLSSIELLSLPLRLAEIDRLVFVLLLSLTEVLIEPEFSANLESEIEPLSDAEVDLLIRPELLRLALTDAETLSELFRESDRLPDLLELSL